MVGYFDENPFKILDDASEPTVVELELDGFLKESVDFHSQGSNFVVWDG